MEKEDKERKLWLNGKIIPEKEFSIKYRDHIFHYGTGVFEGIRAHNTDKGVAIFKLFEHIDRLYTSAKGAYLDIPFYPVEIFKACVEIVRISGFKECYVRPNVYFAKQDSMGLKRIGAEKVQVAIGAWEWDSYLKKEALEKGIRVATSCFRKLSSGSIYDIKGVGNYFLYYIAKEEARQRTGCDEVVFLDEQGCVTECSAMNIFYLARYGKKIGLVTPSLNSSILSGITRDAILKIAYGMGYSITDKRFPMQELLDDAIEVFTTGTASGITPVIEIGGKIIGNGEPGENTKKIQKAYDDIVHGRNPKYLHWLTLVKNRKIGKRN